MSRRTIPGWIVATGGMLAVTGAPPARAMELQLKGETWVYAFAQRNAYFSRDYHYLWLEAMARGRGTATFGQHLVVDGRLTGLATLGRDVYFDDTLPGIEPFRYEGRVDLLSVGLEYLLDSHLSLRVGRQEIMFGEGFILGDGYSEYGDLLYRQARIADTARDSGYGGAGQWIIPMKSWDAARATFSLGAITVDAMVARLDRTELPDPGYPPDTLAPGYVAAADVAWAGENAGVGVTALRREVFGGDPSAPVYGAGALHAVAARGQLAPGDWKLEAEVVGEAGEEDGVTRRALGARVGVKHTWSMNPYVPWVRLSGFFFGGDDPETTVDERYDALYFDWSDWGRWYLGNIASTEWFGNSDNLVGEVAVGFMPSPVQTVHILVTHVASQTGAGCYSLEGCDPTTIGPHAPLMTEATLIWDWCPIALGKWKPDSRYYFGIEAGVGVPMGVMRDLAGTDPTLEAILFSTISF